MLMSNAFVTSYFTYTYLFLICFLVLTTTTINMADTNDPIWKTYKHRMIYELIHSDPEPEPSHNGLEIG